MDARLVPKTRMNSGIQTVNHQGNNFSWSGDIFDQRYYKPNKRILSFVGQWPYQLQTERTFKFYFIILLGSIYLVPETKALLISGGNLDLFVASFTLLGANVVCLGIFASYQRNRHQIKKIFDQTRENWEYMRGLPQIKFLKEHGEIGRLFTLAYSITTYTIITGWMVPPLLPKFLDAVAPLNQSRQRVDVYPIDFMVDPDKYFWQLYFFLGSGIVVVLSTLVAFDTFFMVVAQHACGMFEILRFDIENILQVDLPLNEIRLHTICHTDVFFHSIVSCVKRHKKLIEYVNTIQTTCEWPLFVTVFASTVFLIFTGYLTIAKSTPKEDVLRLALFTFAQIYHIYCVTLPGHWISCASSLLSDAAYNCKWHMMSLRTRKLIVLFIRANMNPCIITAGKIYVMSMENFSMILKTSMSYLAVLASLE